MSKIPFRILFIRALCMIGSVNLVGQVNFIGSRFDETFGGLSATEAGATAPDAGPSVAAVGVKVDGEFNDWKRKKDLMTDPAGDGRPDGGMDFLKIGGVVSADGLSLYMKVANPVKVGGSNLRIYLDTDGDPQTGLVLFGMGADTVLNFSLSQTDFRFFPMEAGYFPAGISLPAGESTSDILPMGMNEVATHPESEEHEFLIPLPALKGLQPGGKLGILFRDGTGDIAPDMGQSFQVYVPHALPASDDIESFEREAPADIRIASWNVLRDGPMEAELEEGFGRQLAATRPDIINFQELYNASNAWAIQFVSKYIPLDEGRWFAVKNNDCITVSRFPIVRSWSVDANLVVHINTRAAWGFDSVIVNAHTPAFVENQQPRINETSNFMLLLRRMLNGTEPGSPSGEFAIFITGDLNGNSPKLELSIARTGKFADPELSSMNFWPDAYQLPLTDAAPRHTHSPRTFTWRSLTSGNSQRLDYIYYQQSRLTKKKAFVVNALEMPADFLAGNNLTNSDSLGSDHLLLIADFRPRQIDFAWDAVDIEGLGWFFSNWMGWVNNLSEGWFFSHLHGFLYAIPSEQGVWFWDSQFGWWFTHAAYYPYAFTVNTNNWVYFFLFPGEVLYYFDYGAGTWKP